MFSSELLEAVDERLSPHVCFDDNAIIEHSEDLLALLSEGRQGNVLVLALASFVYVFVELTSQIWIHTEQVFLEIYSKILFEFGVDLLIF